MKLRKSDLLAAGWKDSPELEHILARSEEISRQKGIKDPKYLEKLLRREFPHAHAALRMRDEPAPLALAIRAETPTEEKNLQRVLARMDELLRCPVISSGALMPDACPAGSESASMPVGSVITAENALIPAAHSADICCSLRASFYHSELSIDEELDALAKATRFGPGPRPDPPTHPVTEEEVWKNPFLKGLQEKARAHLADQGDGNHFASLGEVDHLPALVEKLSSLGYPELARQLHDSGHEQLRVLVTHHGSRALGAAVFARGLDAAIKQTRRHARDIPDAAAWLYADSPEGENYWQALQYIARWTRANHDCIHDGFLDKVGSRNIARLGNEHNFVWKRDRNYLHGKGATPAWHDPEGRPLLGFIPLNMVEPILLVAGGNQETFSSFAPHGAGRNLSRRALLKTYRNKLGDLSADKVTHAIAEATAGLSLRWYLGQADLSETPVAYKNAETVTAQIREFALAENLAKISPRGCLMAGRAPVAAEKPLSPKQLRQIQHRKERRKTRQRNWLDHSDDDE
ncbi:MAG: RtcB family protein [Verrucomicrobiales bacterium]